MINDILRNVKNEKLSEFVMKHKDAKKQKSVEWLEERKTIIGGSEMSIITGENPYSNISWNH